MFNKIKNYHQFAVSRETNILYYYRQNSFNRLVVHAYSS